MLLKALLELYISPVCTVLLFRLRASVCYGSKPSIAMSSSTFHLRLPLNNNKSLANLGRELEIQSSKVELELALHSLERFKFKKVSYMIFRICEA